MSLVKNVTMCGRRDVEKCDGGGGSGGEDHQSFQPVPPAETDAVNILLLPF